MCKDILVEHVRKEVAGMQFQFLYFGHMLYILKLPETHFSSDVLILNQAETNNCYWLVLWYLLLLNKIDIKEKERSDRTAMPEITSTPMFTNHYSTIVWPNQLLTCWRLLQEFSIYGKLYYRDADETISWVAEKDAVLSSDDFGKDLASVQTLQRKHEGIERDLAALEVINHSWCFLNLGAKLFYLDSSQVFLLFASWQLFYTGNSNLPLCLYY